MNCTTKRQDERDHLMYRQATATLRDSVQRHTPYWIMGGWLLLLMMGPTPAREAQAQQDPLDAAFVALETYEWGPDRQKLLPIDVAAATSYGNADARRHLEERLLKVLDSDAPQAVQSYVCGQLRLIGTPASVPTLARLLDSAELSHMARSALEVIPGEEAISALRTALPHLEGNLKVGVINSLGRRGDAKSVALLAPCLHDSDAAVAGASVAALGRIATPEAAQAVLSFREAMPASLAPAVTDALLRIARHMLQEGRLEDAAGIYGIFAASESAQTRLAALQGLLEAEPATAAQRLIAALSALDERFRSCVEQIVRETADEAVAESLLQALPQLPIAGRVSVLRALGQRSQAAVRTGALASLVSENQELRLAAISALAYSGQSSDVPLLLQVATSGTDRERNAAVDGLHRLSADGVDEQILQQLESSDAEGRVVLIHAIVARRTPGAASRLINMARAESELVRTEAFVALQAIADASMASELVRLLANTPAGAEREAAERAVWKSCSSIADVEQRAMPLLQQLAGEESSGREALLPALGRVGGARALDVIHAAMKDASAEVRNAAVRALCNWPDAAVADELLALAEHADIESHRIWALAGSPA